MSFLLNPFRFGGGGGGGPFSPADLFSGGELGAYWDISETGTLWKDTGGTVPVTADGDSVARVDDLSGNGRHLTQNLFGQRPIYRTSGGLHWLELDGSSDYMSSNTDSTPVTGPTNGGAIWAMYEMADAEAVDVVLIEQNTSSSGVFTALYADTRSTPNRFMGYSPDGSTSYINYSSEQAADARAAIASYDGTTWTGYKDGALVNTLSDSAGFPAGSYRYDLGALVSASILYFNGKFYGGGAVDRELTTSEISDLNNWLRALAGL